MSKQLIGKIGETEIYLGGLSVFSDDYKYLFCFITPDTGMSQGKNQIPFEILRKASAIIFGEDTAAMYLD